VPPAAVPHHPEEGHDGPALWSKCDPHRCGIRRLIAPAQNRRDFEKVPANVAKEMTFIWVRDMDEVIQAAIMLDVDQVGNLSSATDEIPADAIAPANGFGTQVVTDAAPNQSKG